MGIPMKKIYEREWLGIEFSDFAELSSAKLADDKFYKKFYYEFYRKYHSFSELPQPYLKSKNIIAQHLFALVKDKSRILSIGCGNGYVEHRLALLLVEYSRQNARDGEQQIVAIEPNIQASQWISEGNVRLVCGFFPDALDKNENFDFVYASVIDYVFTDDEYLKFLKSVVEFGVKDFLLTDVFTPPELTPLQRLKTYVKELFLFLLEKRQLWGYLRTIDEHRMMLIKAGFKKIEIGEFQHGGHWIRATND